MYLHVIHNYMHAYTEQSNQSTDYFPNYVYSYVILHLPLEMYNVRHKMSKKSTIQQLKQSSGKYASCVYCGRTITFVELRF